MDIEKLIDEARKAQNEGRYKEAIEIYTSHLNNIDDELGKAKVLYHLSKLYLRVGEVYKAQNTITEAIALAKNKEDADILAKVYEGAIDVYSSVGNHDAVQRYFKLGLRYAEDAELETQFNFYNVVAIYLFDRGKIGVAGEYWKKCLNIAKNMGDNHLISIAYNNLGEVYRIRNELEKALRNYKESYEYSKKEYEYRTMAIALLNMGYIERERGELEQSEKYLRESVELYEKHKDDGTASACLGTYALVLADLKKYEDALNAAKKAVALAHKIGDRSAIGEATLYLGYVYEAKGDYKEAMRVYNDAHRVLEDIKNLVLLSECEMSMGRVLCKGNMKEAARFHLERAIKISGEIGEFCVTQKAKMLMSKC